MSSKPPPSLKHFVLRAEARKLYRDVLRVLKGVESGTAAGVREAARAQFEDHAEEHNVEREALTAICPLFPPTTQHTPV
jgi:hypothetical protein